MRKVLRVLGFLLAGLALVVVALAAYIYVASSMRLNRTYAVEVQPLAINTDVDTIERGKHLATAITKCAECHGENLGGAVFLDIPPGRIVASNITSGRNGVAAQMTDEDWVRAIRYGIDTNGHALLVMPTEEFHVMDDADLAAVIAYMKSVPPVDSDLPPTEMRFLGRALMAFGQLNMLGTEHISLTPPPPAPPAGVTIEYGRYLANIGGCVGCHGPGLSGGRVPGTPPELPPASNLTPSGQLQVWSEEDFFRAMREGMRPGDIPIHPFMPWKATRLMTDDEIRATLAYLRSVPPKESGTR